MTLTWSVGQRLTAARLNLHNPVFAYKTADTACTSDTTTNADPHLVLALKANTTYRVTGTLLISAASTTPDFKFGFAWTNTATVYMGNHGLVTSTTGTSASAERYGFGTDSTSPTTETGYGVYTAITSLSIEVLVVVSTSDITLTLQWSQNTSSADATTLKTGSHLVASPVA